MVPSSDDLQSALGGVLALNHPTSDVAHVMVLLPSFSIGETTFLHYADQIPALEHRYLTSLPLLGRIPTAEIVFLSTAEPSPEIVDYHLSFLPPYARADARRRLHMVPVPDHTARPLAAKLLDRPDLLDRVRMHIAGRPAHIEPWNVTHAEMEVAQRLGIPINGTVPELWPLGFKSSGRRLFREAGVPVPRGHEDLHSPDDVLGAIEHLTRAHPEISAVVVKHDNAGSGEGNVVLEVADPAEVEREIASWEDWFVQDLARGGIVEELVTGTEFTSPSAQIDLGPSGDVTVRATHEQIMGGPAGQAFAGCRFSALPDYAAELAEHAAAIGSRLAAAGVVGRVSVDFAAARTGRGEWKLFALEVNLRKGGTTHPYVALRHLAPGRYHPESGQWLTGEGDTRAYTATDNVWHESWKGLEPTRLVDHLNSGGLAFDRERGTGPVLHMLAGLAATGRFGLICIARTPPEADDLHEAVLARLAELS